MPRDLHHYEDQYQDLPFEADQAYLRRQEVLRILKQELPARILEVGCGTSPIFTDHTEFEKMEIVEPGKLFSETARSLAKESEAPGEILIQEALLEDASLEEKQFDFILLSSLLHEVPTPDMLIKKAASHLTPQGMLLINVPNEHSFHRQLAFRAGLIKSTAQTSSQQKALQQSRIFNRESLRELVNTCGLEVVSNETVIFKPFTHRQMQDLIEHKILTRDQVHVLCSMNNAIDPDYGSEIILIAKKNTP